MKKNLWNRMLVMLMVLAMSLSALAACGGGNSGNDNSTPSAESSDETTPADEGNTEGNDDNGQASANGEAVGGKILLLSNLTSGPQYNFYVEYLKMACDNLGYSMEIVYGDGFNDPAANLSQVKNAMSSDVVGLIAMQDGGLNDILIEYPELYVAGFLTDMASVYDEDGASHDAATNDHFLGTLADGHVSGADDAKEYFDVILEKGYKKISIIAFPAFAYPQLAVSDEVFRSLVEEYNATADEADQIEIVSDTEVLTFEVLPDSYFLESEHQDLDAILGLCAGSQFIYPTMVNAVVNGSISADTKLVTGGFEDDADILADFGDDGIIQYISIASVEAMIYPIVLLDNAIQGNQFADYSASKCVDAPQYAISSKEIMDAIVNDSALVTWDESKLALSWEDVQQYFTRYNPDATLADLEGLLASDQLTEKAFIQ